MPQIFITSGTSYTLPADFNPANNTIECYGGGSWGNANSNYNGGGGGAYSKTTNINIAAGAAVQIQVGSTGSAGATDTWFNATSLANAASKGSTLACSAQGAAGLTGGAAASGTGTTRYSGGNGGAYYASPSQSGGGGGGAGGPNGNGGNGGPAGGGGGGGGGCNSGSGGGGGSGGFGAPQGGNGGTNRSGGGAGAGTTGNAGSGTAGGGGGGGGAGNGGNGSLDNVYGDGIHGPGSGGGGGGIGGTTAYLGGAARGYGGGGGGSPGNPGGGGGAQTDGLIVVTYVPAQLGVSGCVAESGILTLRAPFFVSARSPRSADAPIIKMDWLRQPPDLLQRPPGKILYRQIETKPLDSPNPTPQYKPPWLQWPELLRHPVAGIDYRQQFPGKRPFELHAELREGPDTVSTGVFPIKVNDPVNVSLIQYDAVVSIVTPAPELGGADDIIRRVKLLLPKGWWNDVAPIRDAIIGGIADVAAWSYDLVRYAKKQTRVAWATDFWLDIISKDFFRFELSRKVNEPDDKFRLRIQKELIRERVTRQGMIDALTDFTGKVPYVFEPWNPGDCGAWDLGIPAFDIAGHWGDTCLPAQSFVNVVPPGAGIPGAPGWDCAAMGWDIGGMWGDMSLIAGSITDADVYATINKTRPTGAIVWTQLFPPAGPMPLPVAPGPTPNFAPPLMNQVVVPPGAQRYSIATSVTEGLL